MLHVFRVENGTLGLNCRTDDERVIPGKLIAALEREGFRVQPGRRVDAQHGLEDSFKIKLSRLNGHRRYQSPGRNIEELLYHLKAHDALQGTETLPDQFRCLEFLDQIAPVDRIDEDVRVQKTSTAHSIRLS